MEAADGVSLLNDYLQSDLHVAGVGKTVSYAWEELEVDMPAPPDPMAAAASAAAHDHPPRSKRRVFRATATLGGCAARSRWHRHKQNAKKDACLQLLHELREAAERAGRGAQESAARQETVAATRGEAVVRLMLLDYFADAEPAISPAALQARVDELCGDRFLARRFEEVYLPTSLAPGAATAVDPAVAAGRAARMRAAAAWQWDECGRDGNAAAYEILRDLGVVDMGVSPGVPCSPPLSPAYM